MGAECTQPLELGRGANHPAAHALPPATAADMMDALDSDADTGADGPDFTQFQAAIGG